MKKFLCFLLALTMLFAVTACKPQVLDGDGMVFEVDPCTLHIFAAASMQETLTELEKTWSEMIEPDVELVFTFDSSGTLKTQIEEGAVCDIFISAAQKQMNQLEELGLIDAASRVDLLENKVCLCVATNSACGVKSFDDLAQKLKQ